MIHGVSALFHTFRRQMRAEVEGGREKHDENADSLNNRRFGADGEFVFHRLPLVKHILQTLL